VAFSLVKILRFFLQEAVAISFEKEIARLDQDECYFNCIPNDLEAKRDYMVEFLKDVGMEPTVPEGGYVVLADWSPLGNPRSISKRFLFLILLNLESLVDLSSEKDKYRDFRFTGWMTKNVGLQAIPSSVFYSEPNKTLAEHFVRFCFWKKDQTLQKAAQLLNKWNNNTKNK
jgi:kynurenine--oxoglutarate transaminase/cysteine-S-conjugate beta-lyase/glutamine--phenylpyruvate transaminase